LRRRRRDRRLRGNRGGRWDGCGRDSGFLPRRFGRGLLGFLLRLGGGFRGSFGFGQRAKVGAHLVRHFDRDRTRVRLLFRESERRQEVNDCFRLDLKVAGEFVDPNLIRVAHSP
jgi:hypothetical protein